ncbi:IQ domain-containing protein G [Aedes aegypti]|uniref:Dynein regulatory complex protein 9 n=1 Tax=Aedes aegypti TaxID=7159 RepID=A0A6I8T3N6_AEDAE|nr:IQ domain-containing protein G [Aedes aegypti]
MDILERDEQIGICQLLHNALGKLKLIYLNPVNDDLLDPTGAYSIGDLLRQNISHLEHFYQAVDEIDSTEKRFLRESITNSQDDNGENQFSQWQFTKQCMEIKKLETNLADMEKIFENLHQERHERKQLEIACNRFVTKWEQIRREQLDQTLTIRAEEFCRDIALRETEVESGLRAAHRINDFYDWQLAKVETDISDWMDRFDREKEQVDFRSQRARAQIRRWNEMKKEIESMSEEITKLEQQEMEYVKDAEHKRMCQKYAVKLQAWWRGVMVRKGFGPFGKGKKKKSKGKKKATKTSKTRSKTPTKKVNK